MQAKMPIVEAELAVTDEHRASARRYPLAVTCEDDTWIAHCLEPDLRFVIGHGETPAAAIECLIDHVAGQLALAESLGSKVAEPGVSFGGPLSVRLPKSLHRTLVARAEAEGLSLNATVTYLLSQALGTEAPARRRVASR